MAARLSTVSIADERGNETLISPSALQDIGAVRKAAAACRNCELYANAHSLVFGEGPVPAAMMLVGEQPGTQEDVTGLPFVGPAGLLLTRALEEAGIARDNIYIASAVKHFYFRETNHGRRAGVTPLPRHISACRPWLETQLHFVRPRVVVCMGRIAALSVLKKSVSIRANRGQFMKTDAPYRVLLTYHPSAALRVPSKQLREEYYRYLAHDLALGWRSAK